ncbi:uncharacterized protein [Antedon mediterranea]|uniref:uncharacterized protein n=1 Tax=Antedon mediterranea TaxID=105859 RepID=UPI003AF68418
MDGWCVLVLLIASVCFTLAAGTQTTGTQNPEWENYDESVAVSSDDIPQFSPDFKCLPVYDQEVPPLPCAPENVEVVVSPISAWVTFDPVMLESLQGKEKHYRVYYTERTDPTYSLKRVKYVNSPCKLYGLIPSADYKLQVFVVNSTNQYVAQSPYIRFSTPEGRKYYHHCFNKEEDFLDHISSYP